MSQANMDALLASYPRRRPALAPAQKEIYESEYFLNREGGTWVTRLSSALERWMHRRVAARAFAGGATLELGAGSLNHLVFEPESRPYDAVEPFTKLYAGRPELRALRNMYPSIEDVPAGASYDRIVSIAVLEHVLDLPKLLECAHAHLKPGGWFQAGIPSEGAFAWGMAWRCSTGLAYRLRTGFDYKCLMRHEHVNTYPEISALIARQFGNIRVRFFPSPFFHGSFYAYLEARANSLKRDGG